MMKKALLILAVMVIFLGCRRDDLPFYQGGKRLAFVQTWGDGMAYSHTQSGVLADTGFQLAIPVVLIGADNADTAVHYTLLFKSTDLRTVGYAGTNVRVDAIYRGGGSTRDTLFIPFARPAMYMDTVYTLDISLETTAAYATQMVLPDNLPFVRELEVHVDDRFEEPTWWPYFQHYTGHFSSRKMRVIGHWLGLDTQALENLYYLVENELRYDSEGFARRFQQFLEERAASGNPIYERDGELMRAGDLVYEE